MAWLPPLAARPSAVRSTDEAQAPATGNSTTRTCVALLNRRLQRRWRRFDRATGAG
jgi:hypothetical protein